jgi:tetratricopeptide (TPR) repeat protein
VAPTEEVAVQPEQPIVSAPSAPVVETPAKTPARRFDSPRAAQNYAQSGVTPLTPGNPGPASAAPLSGATPAASAPVKMIPPAPPTYPRYLYLSPRKPKAGDRKAATQAFAAAQLSESNQDLTAGMNSYQKAAGLDPAWFEAQYNYAVLAYRLRDFNHSLASSEMALALRPDDTDARYNFALALKAAGYATDAVNELKKIVAANPDEARAQLALGNLYAEQLRDPSRARQHYLKWLALDPHNPQATNIRFWLSDNPQ